MNTANALKIGIWIVIGLVIVIFGTKFFQGVSLSGSYQVVAVFDRVDGLIPGNMAQTKGVRIGQVRDIHIDNESGKVFVTVAINEGIEIREGATAVLVGLAALGDVRVEIDPGPPSNPPLSNGAHIPSATGGDLLGSLTAKADTYLAEIDTILVGMSATSNSLGTQLGDPNSDLRAMLAALRAMSEGLAQVMSKESANISKMLENLEATTGNLSNLTSADSASVAASLKSSLSGLDSTLAATRSLSANLDSLLVKVNSGEGTLGKLATDASLYSHMDSVALNLNRLLVDFRNDPKKYLKEVRMIDFL